VVSVTDCMYAGVLCACGLECKVGAYVGSIECGGCVSVGV
jgi:hypothetical protein